MTTNSHHVPLDDARFDRLVDGELTDNERRALLARLDDEPDGWRRCALAFLEAQCWKEVLSSVAKSKNAAVPSGAERRHAVWLSRLGAPLALAASLLAAIWVGAAVQRIYFGSLPTPVATGTIGPLAVATGDRHPAAVAPSQPDAGPWRMVTVSSPSAGQDGGTSFRVPAVERQQVDPQWLQSLPPAIPDNVLRAFNRTGHEVEQHRELVPIPLNDGRRLVVPVDRVDVKYVPNTTY